MDLDQIAQDYERDGVVRVEPLISSADVETIGRELARYQREIVPAVPVIDRVFEADGKTLRNLWRMEKHDAFFRGLSERPDVLRLAARLVHGTPALHGVETFNKPAKVGSAVPPHQDNAYFCMEPPDMLTIWIALDAATLDNGPIYYIRGSHRDGVKPHQKSGVQGNSMGLSDPPKPLTTSEEVFVGTLQPGDALIHHCQTIHYSSPNHSDRSRCGLLLVYRGEHTRAIPALKENYERILKANRAMV